METIYNEEIHERNPVDLLKLEFNHKIQSIISQKTHDGIIRKNCVIKSNDTRKEFISSVMDEKESSELHSGKKETIVSNDLLLTKESIETEMDKDDTESMHRNKDKYDHSSKTLFHGTIVRETAGAVETNEIKSADIDSSNLLIAE